MAEKLLQTEINAIERAVLRSEKERRKFVSIRREHAEALLEMLLRESDEQLIAGFTTKLSSANLQLSNTRSQLHSLEGEVEKWKRELDAARDARRQKLSGRKAG